MTEIERLRERCEAYKGQVWAGEQEIERLRAALRKVRAIVVDDTADPLGSLDTIDQALNGQSPPKAWLEAKKEIDDGWDR